MNDGMKLYRIKYRNGNSVLTRVYDVETKKDGYYLFGGLVFGITFLSNTHIEYIEEVTA